MHWTKLIDRGGLKHVSDDAYRVMLAIETCVRKFFSEESVLKKQGDLKAEAMANIQSN